MIHSWSTHTCLLHSSWRYFVLASSIAHLAWSVLTSWPHTSQIPREEGTASWNFVCMYVCLFEYTHMEHCHKYRFMYKCLIFLQCNSTPFLTGRGRQDVISDGSLFLPCVIKIILSLCNSTQVFEVIWDDTCSKQDYNAAVVVLLKIRHCSLGWLTSVGEQYDIQPHSSMTFWVHNLKKPL
jgi:hypothetical protein